MSINMVIFAVVLFLLLVVWFRSRAGASGPPDIDPDTATEGDLRTLVMAGRKIHAIKVYRRLHGVDLKAAKEAVERLAAELPPPVR